MRASMTILAYAMAALVAGARSANAQTPTSTCVAQAKADYVACRTQCKQDFVDARFSCRNVDPQCGEACRAGREACVENVDNILESGKLPDGSDLADCTGGTDACRANFKAAKTACNAPCAPNDAECNGCVDNAQLTNFTCRDNCRDSWRANPTVIALRQSCRASFKACVQQCPPASGS